MLRQHMIKEHPTDQYGRYLKDGYWRDIESILKVTGQLDRIPSRGTSGVKASFVRMKEPFRLLVCRDEDPSVKAIWEKVGDLP
jgi:hypothetical protein